MARHWVGQGARRLHLVDLNGAVAGRAEEREGDPRDHRGGRRRASPIQLGGGIRDLDTIERYLDAGVTYVIIGTAAVKNPGFLPDACYAFPGHIIVGLDAKDGKVAVEGWSKMTGHDVVDLAKKFEDYGVEALIYTDIGRDGMLTGVNIEATLKLAQAIKIPVIACGGAEQPRGRQGAVPEAGARGRHRRDHRPRALRGHARLQAGAGGSRQGSRRRRPCKSCSPSASFPASTSPRAAWSRASISSSLRDAGDPVEIARALRRAGRRRARLPRHHRELGRARHHPARHRGGGRAGVHSAHRGRRRAQGRGRAPAAERRRRQGVDQHRRGAEPAAGARRLAARSARSASWWPSTRSRPRRRRRGRCSRTAGARPPGSTRSTGRGACDELGAGEILLTSMDRDGTRDGFDLALTRAVADAVERPGDRLAAASAPSSTSPRACSRAAPTRCSRRASSTSASSPCAQAKEYMRAARHRGAAVSATMADDQLRWDERRPGAGDRAGRDERRVLMVAWMNRERCARPCEQRRGGLLVALAQAPVAQGRGIGPRAEGAASAPGLRRRRDPAARSSRSGGIACHTGRESCFFRKLENGRWVSTDPVLKDPEGHLRQNEARTGRNAGTHRAPPSRSARAAIRRSPTSRGLLARGEDAMLKKIGEEATETVLAAKDGDRLHLVRETADLWFHCLIMLAQHGLGPRRRAGRAAPARGHLRHRREGARASARARAEHERSELPLLQDRARRDSARRRSTRTTTSSPSTTSGRWRRCTS